MTSVFSSSMHGHMQDADALQKAYNAKTPYPHIVLQDVCRDEVLRGVREEIIANFQVRHMLTLPRTAVRPSRYFVWTGRANNDPY